jgi:signal peptidase II
MRRFGRWAFMMLLLGVTGCDQATKHLAARVLATGEPRELIPGLLDLRRAMNTDTAFSLLGDFVPTHVRVVLLMVLAVVGSILMAAFIRVRWSHASTLERVGGAVLLGGAVGNALDRVLRLQVIDFIHLRYWPTFNVADIALCVGVGLVLWSAFKARRTMDAA